MRPPRDMRPPNMRPSNMRPPNTRPHRQKVFLSLMLSEAYQHQWRIWLGLARDHYFIHNQWNVATPANPNHILQWYSHHGRIFGGRVFGGRIIGGFILQSFPDDHSTNTYGEINVTTPYSLVNSITFGFYQTELTLLVWPPPRLPPHTLSPPTSATIVPLILHSLLTEFFALSSNA